MSILRFAARSLLASFFIAEGAQAAMDPDLRLSATEKITAAALPLAPSAIADYLPDDPRTWARITGFAQIAGGIGLAMGIARRPCAALLGVSMIPAVMDRPAKDLPEVERKAARAVHARNLGLFGAVLLAALDTEGKPDLAWRATDAKRRLAKESRRHKRQVKKSARWARKRAEAMTGELKSAVTK